MAKKKTKKSIKTQLTAFGLLVSTVLNKERFTRLLNVFRTLLLKKIKQLGHWVIDTPARVRGFPSRVKKWIREDRKKKKYRSFRLQKKIKPEPRYIPSSGELLKSSTAFLWKNKKIFFFIILIHAFFYVTIIRSPLSTSIGDIQTTINSVLGDNSQKTTKGTLATLGSVLTVSTSSQSSKSLLPISIFLMSLIYIWAIRELHAKQTIKARDAYYRGLSPLISCALVLIVASIQLIPFAAAASVYGIARSSSLFASGFEDLSIFIVALIVGVLSLFWVTSTIIAFYIVTLPGMYPMKALRSAKKIVQFQRFQVFKRIFALPILLILCYLLLLALVIRFATGQVFFLIELLQLIILPLIHVYLYKLYRTLI